MGEIVAALRAPSFQQDSQWHHPKANYATKPRDLLDAAADRIEALEAVLNRCLCAAEKRRDVAGLRFSAHPAFEDAANLLASPPTQHHKAD